MKKFIGILIISTVLLYLLLYFEGKYHILYDNACGEGITGITAIVIVGGFMLLYFMLASLMKNRIQKVYCKKCSSEIQIGWNICPNCGEERIGDR